MPPVRGPGSVPPRSHRLHPVASSLALLLASACPLPPSGNGTAIDPGSLPDDPMALLELAERWSRPGEDLDHQFGALTALEKAEALHADPFVTQVLRARTCFRLAEDRQDHPHWSSWLEVGIDAAEAAAAQRPERVEGHYYLATLLGRRAERATVGALEAIPRIQAAAERAVEIDPTIDNCGPLVALGMLYVAAPPWPQSIGDPETGIEYLRQAVECTDFPVNRILLAEALLDQGEYLEARELLRWVLARPPEGLWGLVGNTWRPHARELLERAEHPQIE